MPPIRQVVLIVHGVNPDRTWQERTAWVLEPHFRSVSHEYDDYLTARGPVRAVIHLWAVLPFVVGLALAGTFFAFAWTLWWIAGAGLLAVLAFLVGLRVAYNQRQDCLRRVKTELLSATQGEPAAPHVIAHSFGAYLVGSALLQFTDVRFDRVVLVGAVLPRRYKWALVNDDKPEAVAAVRNETGNVMGIG